jgi:hypothetical protein
MGRWVELARRIDFDADPVFGLACMDGADAKDRGLNKIQN